MLIQYIQKLDGSFLNQRDSYMVELRQLQYQSIQLVVLEIMLELPAMQKLLLPLLEQQLVHQCQ